MSTPSSATPLTYSVRYADPERGADTTRVGAHHWRETDNFVEFVDSSDRAMFAIPRDELVYIRLVENEGA